MRLASCAQGVVARAPAKVNLFLEVLGKRPDGYHDIATLMLAVRLYDTLVFKEEPSGQLLLECTQLGRDKPELSTGPDNLVLRAAVLLKTRHGVTRGAAIRLVKRIPLAAGLAGGSTDAAATLAGLNRMWNLGLTNAELANLGAELGSDVAFFLKAPAAWCTGRGEIVRPLKLARPIDLVLMCPEFGMATAEVYRNVTAPAKPQTGEPICGALAQGDVEEMGRLLFNRLQPAAERLAPAIATYHHRLEQLRPAGQLMSGSGSSLFALCRDRQEAERIASELRHGMDRDSFSVYQVRSCS